MARPRSLFGLTGYATCTAAEAGPLLQSEHYLGPLTRASLGFAQFDQGEMVAVQLWGLPTSRRLPNDGTWLELARWCLTPEAGRNAGSRQHAAFIRWLRGNRPDVTTLVSYSDPSQGHTGALYRSCNWVWAPTWHRLSPPPSGNGSWGGGEFQGVKDRWFFPVQPDAEREAICQRVARLVERASS